MIKNIGEVSSAIHHWLFLRLTPADYVAFRAPGGSPGMALPLAAMALSLSFLSRLAVLSLVCVCVFVWVGV